MTKTHNKLCKTKIEAYKVQRTTPMLSGIYVLAEYPAGNGRGVLQPHTVKVIFLKIFDCHLEGWVC